MRCVWLVDLGSALYAGGISPHKYERKPVPRLAEVLAFGDAYGMQIREGYEMYTVAARPRGAGAAVVSAGWECCWRIRQLAS